MNPSALGNAPGLINFNCEEQGRSFTVFKTPVSFASVISVSGAGNLSEFDGVYICVPGTQFQVNWTVDTQRWGALVGASREVGIQLIGDLVSCRSGVSSEAGTGWLSTGRLFWAAGLTQTRGENVISAIDKPPIQDLVTSPIQHNTPDSS